MRNNIGIILMTYGSATTSENVAAYLQDIYHGKASKELIADFEERYRLVGRSPLIEITERQAALLEARLAETNAASAEYIVRAGMLHSAPSIDDAVRACKEVGVTVIKGIILSPQFSSFIMDGYRAALFRAAKEHGFQESAVSVAEPWPTEPHFIELLSQRVMSALHDFEARYSEKIPVVFTTHSLPKRVVDRDPGYLEQLTSTIHAVIAHVARPDLLWFAGYQSAGHTPEAWLTPDLVDILGIVQEKKLPAVLIVPIQFLADHLEILYDLDIAARAQCEERGIAYHRIVLPNIDPLFIDALAAIVQGAW